MKSREGVQLLRRYLIIPSLWGTISVGILRAGGPASSETVQGATPSESSAQEMTSEELFSKLLEHNLLRETRLRHYSSMRTYELRNTEGKVQAKAVVRVEYQQPGTKTFTTQSEEGSRIVRRLVFKRLMESEVETTAGPSRRDSSIRPENYTLQVLGEEDVRGYHCFVVGAVPTHPDKYLFEGKVWIDSKDFAVVKIAGRPAKNPSFWIKRIDFARQYQKIGDFWLPWRDESVNEVRIYGKKILSIDHHDYALSSEESGEKRPQSVNGDPPPGP